MSSLTFNPVCHPSPLNCTLTLHIIQHYLLLQWSLVPCAALTVTCWLILLSALCVYTGEPVVWAGGFHSQYGDLWLSSGRQAGQQQEHPETQILQTGTALYTVFTQHVLMLWRLWIHWPIKCLYSLHLFLSLSVCQHCTLDLGSYIKDLSVVHDDLSSIVILDNSPGAYRSHPGKTTSYSPMYSVLFTLTLWIRCATIFKGTFQSVLMVNVIR